MKIILTNIWKRYNAGWVIKDFSNIIDPQEIIALKGANGSGKSTLLHLISGYLPLSKGDIAYKLGGKNVSHNDIYNYCSISAAYAELDEELSIRELFSHYRLYKPFIINDFDAFIEFSMFQREKDKIIKTFSSGMKQRLNLAMVLNFDVPLLLLDEPGSFLDKEKKSWFADNFNRFTEGKTVLIASNEESDLHFCNRTIELN